MLNLRRFRFAPRPFATLATVIAVLAFAGLGQWQLSRGAEKRALAAEFGAEGQPLALPNDSRALPRYQPVIASGRYDPDHQFLLDNQIHEGQAGVRVWTPFVLDGGGRVIVDRGWLPFGATRADLPDTAVDAEPRQVAGKLDELPRAGILLPAPPSSGWPKLMSFPTIDELAAQLDARLHSRIILLDPTVPDGYVREWKLPGTPAVRHLSYAIQWFAFAATALAIWIALSLRRRGEDE